MPARYMNDPDHWTQQAATVRTLAETASSDKARAELLSLAADYDYLARRAQWRAQGGTREE